MKPSNYVAAAVLAVSAASVMAQTPTRPSVTPQVTVSADTKLLIFDWDPVPGATYYQLYMNQDGHSGFTPTGGRIAAPGTRAGSSVSVHLQHWQDALYQVSACNAAGCRNSKALFPRRHMLETIGYFKASNTGSGGDTEGDAFGSTVALSSDGSTMAVTAPDEDSNATGVNGDQSNNEAVASGAVYVFRKASGHWRQEAYLKAPDNLPWKSFGGPFAEDPGLALSSDGSVLAVSAPGSTGAGSPGEVFTFIRAGNGAWSLASTLRAPDSKTNDSFGMSVDMSADGTTLKVMSMGNPHPKGETAYIFAQGRTYLFKRTATGWQHLQSIEPWFTNDMCNWVRMSGDGSTLVQYCAAANRRDISHAVTFKRDGDTWTHVSDLQVGPLYAGQTVALSADARALALITLDGFVTNVHVFRWQGAGWTEEQTLPAVAADEQGDGDALFGTQMAFNGAGTLLAINSVRSPPAPPGISESIPSGDSNTSGAVLMYERRSGSAPWAFRSLVKAPNPDTDDEFGFALAMSATGNTLAVGAPRESSKSRGIGGDQTDNSLPYAGAVYMY